MKCATDHELKMSMEVDYDGNKKYDYPSKNNEEKTWWITNFNPNGEKFIDNNHEFKASDMIIRYDINLSDDMDIYYSWQEQEKENEYSEYIFDNGHVIYEFVGEGD